MRIRMQCDIRKVAERLYEEKKTADGKFRECAEQCIINLQIARIECGTLIGIAIGIAVLTCAIFGFLGLIMLYLPCLVLACLLILTSEMRVANYGYHRKQVKSLSGVRYLDGISLPEIHAAVTSNGFLWDRTQKYLYEDIYSCYLALMGCLGCMIEGSLSTKRNGKSVFVADPRDKETLSILSDKDLMDRLSKEYDIGISSLE